MDTRLISNTALYNLKSDIKADRLTHSYLFISGDAELNKEVTKYAAKIIMCTNKPKGEPCGVCSNCMKVEKNIHPDLHVYGKDKKIMVEDVKDLLESVYVAPFETDKKIYILNGVEDMNDASQNKILKTIEEPPQNTFMLLSTTNEYKVLETIKSRCKRIYVPLLKVSELEEELVSRGIDNAKMIALESSGNLSVALKLAESKVNSDGIYKLVTSTFENYTKIAFFTDYYAKFNTNKANFGIILDLFQIIARDMIVAQTNENGLVMSSESEFKLMNMAGGFTIDGLAKIIELVTEEKKKLAFNTNVDGVIYDFLLKFLEVRVKCKKQLG